MIRKPKPSQACFADPANRQSSPKPRFADHLSESRASLENIDFVMTWLFGGASAGRQ